jgi:hypothetical protein
MTGDPIPAAILVIRALERLGVPYLVGGSLASSVYGTPRATNDVDLVADLRPHHVDGLLRELGGEFAVEETALREAVAKQRQLSLIHVETVEKIDVFLAGQDAWTHQQLSRRQQQSVEGSPVGHTAYYATPEDTVLSKLRWYRQGREVSERQWSDVVSILRVQAGALDDQYLDRWAAELGVADLLERARQDAAA